MVSILIKKIVILVLVIIFIMFATRWYLLQPPQDVTLENGARLKWSSCWFDIPLNRIIHCANLYPSLQNENNSISLPVVVFRDYSIQHKPDPVLFINGGPGYASGLVNESIGIWTQYIEYYGWNRDFVVFDQRGTGLARPKPECPELFDFYADVMIRNMTLKEESRKNYFKIRQCFRHLEKQHNLANYSTTHNTQDIQDLTRVMNYLEWNLFGVSYGTRVALEVMRRSPDNIRSVILDSVYPANKHSLLIWPGVLDNTIEMIFQRCENDEQCNAEYPNLRELFKKSLQELSDRPIQIYYEDPDRTSSMYVTINDFRFVMALYIAMYDSQLLSDLPAAIHGAVYGDSDSMLPVVYAYIDSILDKTFNDAIYYSVECNDQEPISAQEYQSEIKRYPRLRKYYRYDLRYDPCHKWPKRTSKRLSVEPVTSAIPTLILSGQYDPATPRQWGAEVHQYLLNSFHLVYSDVAHGVIDSDDCAVQASREFLNQPKQLPNKDC